MEKRIGCYLMHFTEPLAHAQHYLGVAPTDIDARVRKHVAGTSRAKLPEAVHEKGIGMKQVREWLTDTPKQAYILERKLKARKNGRKLCPICTGTQA